MPIDPETRMNPPYKPEPSPKIPCADEVPSEPNTDKLGDDEPNDA